MSMQDELVRLEQTQHDVLFYLNMIKNSQAVYVGDNQVLTRLYTGQKIYVDSSDISVSPALMFDGTWEPEVTGVFTELLRPSDTFIDVGANMGFFGIVAGTVINREHGGKIAMIEANPRLVPLIFKSINVCGLLGTATVANFAISDHEGELELQVVKHYLGSSAVDNLEVHFDAAAEMSSTVQPEVLEKVVVPSITLDAYAERESLGKVDLIKIDIEGHEEFAYAGMTKIIDENRASLRLLIEYSMNRYSDSAGFFDQIQDDFKFVYAIEHGSGNLIKIEGMDHLSGLAGGDWIMLVASNEYVTG